MIIKELIISAALAVGVNPQTMTAICWVESNHKPHVVNLDEPFNRRSHGVCQIQTRTARYMGFKGSVKDLYNPYTNAYWASKYYLYQVRRYKNKLDAIAAYNAGRAKKKTNGNYINQKYVDKVLKAIKLNR